MPPSFLVALRRTPDTIDKLYALYSQLTPEDIRAAVAGQPSVLHGIHHIERGYHRPFDQFASLGLTIRRG